MISNNVIIEETKKVKQICLVDKRVNCYHKYYQAGIKKILWFTIKSKERWVYLYTSSSYPSTKKTIYKDELENYLTEHDLLLVDNILYDKPKVVINFEGYSCRQVTFDTYIEAEIYLQKFCEIYKINTETHIDYRL